ncbi:hypothetical protein THOM_1002 [Trachipleistophora hominis]|uniref:Uncharacterized protein n=1 Tax=Trachipleistophora hominis TaxID=72359 RepID=L7JX48_TRAHO|nr:hypothetical protein THOM_1002 [Trachipleistophora hominis]
MLDELKGSATDVISKVFNTYRKIYEHLVEINIMCPVTDQTAHDN